MSKAFQDGDDLGYVYISENTNAGINDFKTYDVKSDGDMFMVTYTQCLQSFDVLNRNQRYYDKDNVWDCIAHSEKIQSQLAHNGWFSELDHPMAKYADKKLSPERIQNPEFRESCCVIKNPRLEGNLLMAEMTTLPNKLGTDLAKMIVGVNYRPMASCRAIANMQSKNGKPYVFVKRLITYDTVNYASHREADMISPAKTIVKKFGSFTESVKDFVEEADRSVVVPLREILQTVVNKDVTTQMVMESFNLTDDSIIGFNDNNTHAIIKEADNRIYVKMSPDTVKEVNDYFASF